LPQIYHARRVEERYEGLIQKQGGLPTKLEYLPLRQY
jgi:hypothetical protein